MKSLEELRAIRERMQSQVSMRAEDHNHTRVVVGMATCGIASGARPVLTKLSSLVLSQSNAMKLSRMEPGKQKITYIKMTPEKAEEVLERHLIGGHIVEEYTLSGADIK